MKLLKHQETPSGDWWDIWYLKTGRAAGKTTAAINFAKEYLDTGLPVIWIAPATMGRHVASLLQEDLGSSVTYSSPKRRLTHRNGGYIQFETRSTESEHKLRGQNYAAMVWEDIEAVSEVEGELALQMLETISFGLRVGEKPRVMLTASDKSPVWLAPFVEKRNVAYTRADTKANAANLSKHFLEAVGIV